MQSPYGKESLIPSRILLLRHYGSVRILVANSRDWGGRHARRASAATGGCHSLVLVQAARVHQWRAGHRGVPEPVTLPQLHLAHDHDAEQVVVGGEQRHVSQGDVGRFRSPPQGRCGVVRGLSEAVSPVRMHQVLPYTRSFLEQIAFTGSVVMRD